MSISKYAIPVAAAALIAMSGVAGAQSGTAAGQDPHRGPAQEGGRTQATPGASASGNAPAVDTTGTITPRSGTAAGQDPHKGPAQEGGRTQATPGGSR